MEKRRRKIIRNGNTVSLFVCTSFGFKCWNRMKAESRQAS